MDMMELDEVEAYLRKAAGGQRCYFCDQEGDEELAKWLAGRFAELRAREGAKAQQI